MSYLTRDQILAATDILVEEVEVPEWGGTVRVRGLTGKERDLFESSVISFRGRSQKVNLSNLRAKLVSMSVVDEDDKALFRPSDAERLGEKSAAALQRVWEVAQRLSGLSEEDIEELTEELKDDPFSDSPSD